MLRQLFKRLGYDSIDDAVNFLMCGLSTLPILLMLAGFMLAGAIALMTLLILVAAVGSYAPPPEPPADRKIDPDDNPPKH